MQMFPNLAARETCCGNKFCFSGNKKMFLPGAKTFSASRTQILRPKTYVSQFSHPGKHNEKHCFRNNVSQFSLSLTCTWTVCFIKSVIFSKNKYFFHLYEYRFVQATFPCFKTSFPGDSNLCMLVTQYYKRAKNSCFWKVS